MALPHNFQLLTKYSRDTLFIPIYETKFTATYFSERLLFMVEAPQRQAALSGRRSHGVSTYHESYYCLDFSSAQERKIAHLRGYFDRILSYGEDTNIKSDTAAS